MQDNKKDLSRRSVLHSVQGDAPKRRGFLKSTVAAVGSVLGLSSSATAVDSVDRDALQAAAREYYSPEQVRDALETHGATFLRI
jgi:Rieske Fe-S protein